MHINRKSPQHDKNRPLIMGHNTSGSTVKHNAVVVRREKIITQKSEPNNKKERIAFFGILSRTGKYYTYLKYISMTYIGNITLNDDLYIKYVAEQSPDTDFLVSKKSVYDDVEEKVIIVGDLYEIDKDSIVNILRIVPNSFITNFKTNNGEDVLSITLLHDANDEYQILI